MARPIKPRTGKPMDIRLVLEPMLADAIRDEAKRADRTLPAEIARTLRREYLDARES